MRHLLRAGLVLGLFTAVACSDDSTAPELSDPAALAAELAAAGEPFETPVFQSLSALGGLSGPALGAAAAPRLVAATLPRRPEALEASGDPNVRSVAKAERLRALVPQFSIGARQDTLLPDTLEGTWVWDLATDSYVKSVTRDVGPDTVRIILYVIDEATSMPVEPVDEVGRVDIVDNEPTGAGYSLGVTVKDSAGTITYADYDVTVTPGAGSFTASALGSISNGLQGAAARTLSFNLAIVATGTETAGTVSADAMFNLSNPSISIEQHDDATFDGNTVTFSRNFTFERPGETVTLDGTITVEELGLDDFEITLDVTVRVEGGPYAHIEGTITITDGVVTGQEITITGRGSNQAELLEELTLAGDSLFGAINALFHPVESLTP